MHAVATTLRQIEAEVNAWYFERSSAIHAMLLAVLAKEHVYIKGSPGTGKSDLTRNLVSRFVGADYFEGSCSKTRPAEAFLGPLDMVAIKHSEFVRKGDGYLQTAHMAFIDEVGKMSSVLGHNLLSVLNERLLHEVKNGRSAQAVPLYTCFTASNEPIVTESDDAAALWDRLLVRCQVDYIQEASNFAALMDRADVPATFTTVDFKDLADVIDHVIPAIPMTKEAVEAVAAVRTELRSQGMVVSDRRWRASCKVMRASAFLDGRDEVTADDVEALEFTLWDTEEQIIPVQTVTFAASSPLAAEIIEFSSQLHEIRAQMTAAEGKSQAERADLGTELNGKLAVLQRAITRLHDTCVADDRSTTKVDGVQALWNQAKVDQYIKCLGMSEETARMKVSA